ncbi:hypothetical protein SAMN06265360_11932 [Haloechinothrix alba]|uniref:Uncharacterized protein n=1 Tax=Haloechinothrix alba TaxID=664784 RepID=A0A238Z632_9PSEU|nr:hypothetical protein [Haloechinothrix alba]SNR78263.1 hypothetical protein SAMN06265360_11932 [Haloechinothrix alba]
MRRESGQRSPREDEERKEELAGLLRGNRPARAQEWRDPEPPAEDDPEVPPFSRRQQPRA